MLVTTEVVIKEMKAVSDNFVTLANKVLPDLLPSLSINQLVLYFWMSSSHAFLLQEGLKFPVIKPPFDQWFRADLKTVSEQTFIDNLVGWEDSTFKYSMSTTGLLYAFQTINMTYQFIERNWEAIRDEKAGDVANHLFEAIKTKFVANMTTDNKTLAGNRSTAPKPIHILNAVVDTFKTHKYPKSEQQQPVVVQPSSQQTSNHNISQQPSSSKDGFSVFQTPPYKRRDNVDTLRNRIEYMNAATTSILDGASKLLIATTDTFNALRLPEMMRNDVDMMNVIDGKYTTVSTFDLNRKKESIDLWQQQLRTELDNIGFIFNRVMTEQARSMELVTREHMQKLNLT